MRVADIWSLGVRGSASAVRPLGRLWRSDRALDGYALVHMASAAGDALVAVALADTIFFSVPVGQARVKVALYLGLTMAPLAVAAPLLVPLLDRGGFRRVLCFVAAAGRAAASAFAITRTSSALLFPAIFVVLVLSKVHGVTRNGLVAAYAGDAERLMPVNARLARLGAVGVGIASLPGLVLLKLAGGPAVLVLATLAYATCAMFTVRLPQPPAPLRVEAAGGALLRRGRLPPLGTAAAGTASLRAAQGFMVFLVAFSLRSGGHPTSWFGLVLFAGVVGGVAGDVLGSRLRQGAREEGIVLTALLVAGLGAVVTLQVFSLGTLTVFSCLTGFATETARLAFQSLMQREAPGGLHGSVYVRYEVVFQLAWVAGAFVPALVPVPFRWGVALLGVFALAAGFTYLFRAEVVRRRPMA